MNKIDQCLRKYLYVRRMVIKNIVEMIIFKFRYNCIINCVDGRKEKVRKFCIQKDQEGLLILRFIKVFYI